MITRDIIALPSLNRWCVHTYYRPNIHTWIQKIL